MSLNFANNNSLSAITTKPSGLSGGAMNLISTQTASSSSTISFTSGIDSTYDEYVFKFINIHPSTEHDFTFQVSINGGSSYGVNMTTTFFQPSHNEADTSADLTYQTGADLAQSTSFQILSKEKGNANDDNTCGELHLFAPASTTFVNILYQQIIWYINNLLHILFKVLLLGT